MERVGEIEQSHLAEGNKGFAYRMNKKNLCPECEQGNLYGRTDLKMCYNCGYHWSDSEGYSESPELMKSLMRKWFPTKVRWNASPEIIGDFHHPKN